MDFNIEEHNVRIVIVTLSNRIDAFSAPALRERFNAIFDQGVNHLVIDLTQVTFLDSAAMAALVSALKRARLAGGDVKLVWPESNTARRIFYLTKFDRVFDFAPTAEAARQSFGAQA